MEETLMPKATVRVMNSHDYSHFEVVLGSDEELTLAEINKLRIQAQKLVDEAIRQYKAKKEHESRLSNLSFEYERLKKEVAHIKDNYREDERTPEQRAKIKALDDHEYIARQYEYDGGPF